MLTLKKADISDCSKMMEIEKCSFSDPWSQGMFEGAILNDRYMFLCLYDGDKMLGYVGILCVEPECDVVNVAVLPELRRLGYGSLLLRSVIDEGKKRGVDTFHLEVRASNISAIKLYESFGFENDGIRRAYYQNPREDALLMTLKTE